jgi:hypothetical protein
MSVQQINKIISILESSNKSEKDKSFLEQFLVIAIPFLSKF